MLAVGLQVTLVWLLMRRMFTPPHEPNICWLLIQVCYRRGTRIKEESAATRTTVILAQQFHKEIQDLPSVTAECIGVKNKDDSEFTRSLELLLSDEESGRAWGKATFKSLHRRYIYN